jgi:hypothetical protein
MRASLRRGVFALSAIFFGTLLPHLVAQSTSGTITGSVTDSTGAVVPGASVTILNPVSGYTRTAKSDGSGSYQFQNIPFNPYHLTVKAAGFASFAQDVEVKSPVVVKVASALNVETASTTVKVESTAGDLVEDDSTMHTDIDRSQFQELPLESATSSVSSLVTLSSPGISSDSNGMFHGLGDHASNSFSVDGQAITDQTSKTFSNQIPSNSIQSLEVISGAPPAEYGGKTALVIQVTTRSGQGVTQPTGSFTTSYGSFGTVDAGFDISYGGQNWGNFFELDGLNSGRFLDPPEFVIFHDKGNEQNLFDRVDYKLSAKDSVRLNLNYSRSWFQTPNSYDSLNVSNVVSGGASANPVFGNVGNADQRSKIGTFDIAPTYTHVLDSNALFTFGPYIRKDKYNYYPSGNPLSDRGPANLQTSSISQDRTLTNIGVHSDISYASTLSRSGRSTARRSFARTICSGSSTPHITHPAPTRAATRSPATARRTIARRASRTPTTWPCLLPTT